jgi:hypothetical protein
VFEVGQGSVGSEEFVEMTMDFGGGDFTGFEPDLHFCIQQGGFDFGFGSAHEFADLTAHEFVRKEQKDIAKVKEAGFESHFGVPINRKNQRCGGKPLCYTPGQSSAGAGDSNLVKATD